jgi:ribonucleotide reductase alpha subunit
MEKDENQKEWDGNFYDLLKDWKFVPGGRILFAITDDIKNKTGRRKITPFNCFVLPQPEDNLESIFDVVQKAARVYSYGGGVGIDVSKIRPAGAKVNNSAIYSDGVVPFMNLYSAVTTNIAISGRRGAMLLSISDKSPDILNFINAKKDHTKITSANISVKLSDAFMKAVEQDGDWEVYFKVKDSGEEIKKTYKAKEIFDNIIKNNWQSAEPGVLFWDKVLHWTPNEFFDESPIIGTNPCLHPDTLVLVREKSTKIEFPTTIKRLEELSLKAGVPPFQQGYCLYEISSYDEEKKQLVWDDVVDVFKTKENAELIELELENGQKLRLTPDHKVFTTNKGWVEAKDLSEEDDIKIKEE